MSNTNTKTTTTTTNGYQIGATFPFDALNDAGAYICNWSGHLLRVPTDGVTPGRSPLINIVGNEPLTVTKISNDPYITITKAKLLASNFDIAVNF